MLSIDIGGHLPPPLFELANAANSDVANANSQNAARPATSTMTVDITGSGQTVRSKPVPFDTAFDGKPVFTYGVELTKYDPAYAYPSATAGVYKWVIDAKGLYTGCYLYFHVDVEAKNLQVLQYAEMSARMNLSYQYSRQTAFKTAANQGYYSNGYWWPPGFAEGKDLYPGDDGTIAGAQYQYYRAVAAYAAYHLYAKAQQEQQKVINAAVKLAEAQQALATAALAKAVAAKAPTTITTFHLSFYGTALKVLPPELTDDSSPTLPTYNPPWTPDQPIMVQPL
jgi:hypothetical protein